jgi:hypothetical protein
MSRIVKYKYVRNDINDICSTFAAESVEYFLDSGSLLGAVRTGSMVPNDGDVDFGLLNSTEGGLFAALIALKTKGFTVQLKRYSVQLNRSGIPISCTFYKTQHDHLQGFWGAPKSKGLLGVLMRIIYWFNAEQYQSLRFKQALSLGVVPKYVLSILGKILPVPVKSKIDSLQYRFGPRYLWWIPKPLIRLGNYIKFEGADCAAPYEPEKYLSYRYGYDWRIPRAKWNTVKDDKCLVESEKHRILK